MKQFLQDWAASQRELQALRCSCLGVETQELEVSGGVAKEGGVKNSGGGGTFA